MNKLFVFLTLCAFAGNSVLCRLALGGDRGEQLIDPISFTTIRLLSGALILSILISVSSQSSSQKLSENQSKERGSWKSAIALFIYALFFSLAYLSLPSGTGALILFGLVQLTMLITGFIRSERMGRGQWICFLVALIGLVYLFSPGLTAPDLSGSLLMAASGVAWGFYTLAGKGSTAPIEMTAGNFIKATPLALLASLITLSKIEVEAHGIILAVISGALTSGLAYSLWYKVLPTLTTTQAAILQLLVPLLATLGGIIFIRETFTLRIAIAGILILGGVIFSTLTPTPEKETIP